MSRHPAIEHLRRFARGELADAQRARTARHLQTCDACRRATQWTGEVVSVATAATARPVPPGTWEHIARRVAEGESVILPATDVLQPPSAGARGVRAAALILLAAGGLAAAVPGTPVRAWLEQALAALVPEAGRAPVTPGEVGTVATIPEVAFLVTPVRSEAVVALERPAAGVLIRLRIGTGHEVEVRLIGAAAAARVTHGEGRLAVADASGGEVVVALPAALAAARVVVDGVAYFTKRGATLTVLAPGADTLGAEIVVPVRAGGVR